MEVKTLFPVDFTIKVVWGASAKSLALILKIVPALEVNFLKNLPTIQLILLVIELIQEVKTTFVNLISY